MRYNDLKDGFVGSPIFQFRVEPYGASRKKMHYLKSVFSPVMIPERILEYS